MEKLDIPQGTLDLMILTMLSREPMHGYGISQRLTVLSQDQFNTFGRFDRRCGSTTNLRCKLLSPNDFWSWWTRFVPDGTAWRIGSGKPRAIRGRLEGRLQR